MNDTTKTYLTDLNFDCITLIFEHLSFIDLLNVAKINDNFKLAANYAFKVKHSKLQIEIVDIFAMPPKKKKIPQLLGLNKEEEQNENEIKKSSPKYSESESCIYIYDYQMIVDIFKCFEVTNLRLIYSNSEHRQAELLGKLITNYSANSLQSVTFESCRKDTIEFIQKPLVNVKRATFGYRYRDYGNEEILYPTIETISFINKNVLRNKHWDFRNSVLEINELLPNVEELNIYWYKPLDYFFTHIPNLRQLYIYGYSHCNESEAYYAELLRHNPQIESIELYNSNSLSLHVISSLMPNLKTLILNRYKSGGFIQFESVTRFIAKFLETNHEMNGLSFPNLRQFSMESRYGNYGRWVSFLRAHSQISEFRFEYFDLITADLLEILVCLPNLEKLYVDIRTNFEGKDSLHNWLRNHAKLHLIQFKFMNKWNKGRFLQDFTKVQSSWNLNYENDKEIVFKRFDPQSEQ